MAKNYKLESKNKMKKKNAADGRFNVETGFFRRYVTSRTGGIVIMVLEVLSLILTSIFALCLGVFGSIFMGTEYDFSATEGMTASAIDLLHKIEGYIVPANTLWLISSIIYIVGTFLLMFGLCRIAAGVHISATVMTVISHSQFMSAHALMGSERDPAVIMMPCIFITIISIVVVMIVYIPRWLDKKNEKDNAKAPSILVSEEEE